MKKRYNISYRKIAGEADIVSDEKVSTFLNMKLNPLMSRFSPENIFNADEFSLFYLALPTHTMAKRGTKCADAKFPRNRLTVMAGANMMGEKLQLTVIGHSAKPRCFTGHNIQALVDYRSNRSAWMNSELFVEFMTSLNTRFRLEGFRLDPASLIGTFSNITFDFLDARMTSKAQPFDAGIIKNIKHNYRTLISNDWEISRHHQSRWQTKDLAIRSYRDSGRCLGPGL